MNKSALQDIQQALNAYAARLNV